VTAKPPPSSPRAANLADRLEAASLALATLFERIDSDAWLAVPAPGVWSPGKDAEHVADGNVLHQWVVRLTIGQAKVSARPRIEREQLTSTRSPAEVIAFVRNTLGEAATLVRGLSDAELDLTTKPPKAGAPSLERTVQGLMIDHIDHHRREIEAKLAATGRPDRKR
jgi:hypothetical protein